MADLFELNEELACLLGLTQAAVQLARRGAVLAGQENECGLVQVLHRLDDAGEQVQRQCQLLIARHARLRGSRITATSRKIKARIMACCHETATIRDVLGLLTTTVDQARAGTVGLAARNPPDNDPAIAEFADFAVSMLEDPADAVTRAFSRLGAPPLADRSPQPATPGAEPGELPLTPCD